MCAFNWSHLGKCFTTAIPWNYNPEWSTLDIVSWNCMIEPEPGHSSHSFHCPSQTCGCVGADSYTLALYNLPGPPPTYKSISKKAAAPNQNLYDMDPNEEKEEQKMRNGRGGEEDQDSCGIVCSAAGSRSSPSQSPSSQKLRLFIQIRNLAFLFLSTDLD